MINNDVLSQLQYLIKTSAPPLLEVSQQQLEMPQLVPGEKVPAYVVANLPNGRFQVLIADKMLDMNLPKSTQPGDTVELVFVTSQPRLTFVLAKDLGNVANYAKPQVSLSETARFLGGLLEKAAQPEGQRTAAAGLAQTAPLLSGAPARSLDFAQVLRGALVQSGLFYESHQAQWVTGQRPLADLLSEPQGKLSVAAGLAQPEVARDEAGMPPRTSPNPQPENAPGVLAKIASSETSALAQQKADGAQQSAASQVRDDANAAKPPAADQPAHPATLPIVRQQLDALDTRQVMWQGQVWQGQSMEWRIEERAAREQRGGAELPEWQTSLQLELPQLGGIAVRLILHPQGVRVQVNAAEAATAKLMTEQRATLQQGMEASGLQLMEIKVSHGTAA